METSTPKRRKISSSSFTASGGRDSSARSRTVTVSTPKEEIAVSPAKTNGIQYFSVSYKASSSASEIGASSSLGSPQTHGTPSQRAKSRARARLTPISKVTISKGKTLSTENSSMSRELGFDASDIREPSICGSPRQAANDIADDSLDDLAADTISTASPTRITADARIATPQEIDVKASHDSCNIVELSEQPPSTPKRHHLEDTDDGEPTLPSTPSQLGVEAPSPPPSGLSTGSSSRRSKFKYRSSPLKPKDEVTGDLSSSPIRASRSPSGIMDDLNDKRERRLCLKTMLNTKNVESNCAAYADKAGALCAALIDSCNIVAPAIELVV
ncbi:MAG: hypothetical protein LQ352_007845 [Teloschistes flavicans]|nr:MAG: hypothetical protein LQ352_007845 [Teloschistes flavicans]